MEPRPGGEVAVPLSASRYHMIYTVRSTVDSNTKYCTNGTICVVLRKHYHMISGKKLLLLMTSLQYDLFNFYMLNLFMRNGHDSNLYLYIDGSEHYY